MKRTSPNFVINLSFRKVRKLHETEGFSKVWYLLGEKLLYVFRAMPKHFPQNVFVMTKIFDKCQILWNFRIYIYIYFRNNFLQTKIFVLFDRKLVGKLKIDRNNEFCVYKELFFRKCSNLWIQELLTCFTIILQLYIFHTVLFKIPINFWNILLYMLSFDMYHLQVFVVSIGE